MERPFQSPASVGDIKDTGIQFSKGRLGICLSRHRELEACEPLLAGLTWPSLPGAGRPLSSGAEPARGCRAAGDRQLPHCPHVLAGFGGAEALGGGAKAGGRGASCARGLGVGRAAWSGLVWLPSSFCAQALGPSSSPGSASLPSPTLAPPSHSSLPPPTRPR